MSGWKLIFEDWKPQEEPLREALCTLGNGYFATRGAMSLVKAGGAHYPGTYLAGGYNRLATEIAGRVVENEDLVNWPNWTCLTFRPQGGEWFAIESVDVLGYRQELDLETGVLQWSCRFRDGEGRETSLVSRRLVHMADMHLAAIEWRLTPENWSGRIEVCSALEGRVRNRGVARYRDLADQHLEPLETSAVGDEGIRLLVRTVKSRLEMAQAARTRVYRGDELLSVERETSQEPGYIHQCLRFDCSQGEAIRLEKIVAIYTCRDWAISSPSYEAPREIERAGSFEELLRTHRLAWERLWRRCDIELEGAPEAQLALRLHIFHLLQTLSPNVVELDVGVPARGLHGEAYRGHIFWDELYVFPFLDLRRPDIARALLLYRYRRLPEAQRMARAAGHQGAMYPWQSGSDGREESQVLHLNPKSGRWVPDHTYLQRHVNAAIAFNIWRHYQATGRREFICDYGGEMILEIARFWASLAIYNPDRQRFEIRGVVGPDEYHTAYPDATEPGIDNNAYTNVMAAWVLEQAVSIPDLLEPDHCGELFEDLQIGADDIKTWDEISRKLFVPFHEDGIISQFEGYENLEEFDWEGYRAKYGDIRRLDRILEAEGDTPNRYKASKQADVLMLFYLFSAERLQQLFQRLGYPFEPELIPKNVDYYLRRTSNGSTLSAIINSWVQARSDRARSWRWFEAGVMSDLKDVQGGTTPEGIHLGAMAGTVDLIQRCYSGVTMRDDILWLNPCLPEELEAVRFRVQYWGHWFSLEITQDKLIVEFEGAWAPYAKIGVNGEVFTFQRGETKEFDLRAGVAAS